MEKSKRCVSVNKRWLLQPTHNRLLNLLTIINNIWSERKWERCREAKRIRRKERLIGQYSLSFLFRKCQTILCDYLFNVKLVIVEKSIFTNKMPINRIRTFEYCYCIHTLMEKQSTLLSAYTSLSSISDEISEFLRQSNCCLTPPWDVIRKRVQWEQTQTNRCLSLATEALDESEFMNELNMNCTLCSSYT